MKQEYNRLNKAFAISTGIHILAAAVIGANFYFPHEAKDEKIIEVALAGAPPKAAKPVAKPKPIIKPRPDDIVDKRLKKPDPVPETTKEEEDVDPNAQESGTGSAPAQGGSGNGPANDSGQAVKLPYITYSTTPPYPSEARKNGTEGTVRIRVLIDTNGRVSEAAVASSSGSSLLDSSALNAVYKWRFSPARNAQGQKVKCYVNIPVVFRIRK